MRRLVLLAVFFSSLALQAGNYSLADIAERADAMLSAYVSNGEVDYEAAKKGLGKHQLLFDMMANASLENEAKHDVMAFWVNAYNVLVIREVARSLPTTSPLDIPGFFDTKKHKVAGELLTLNELEKSKLIKPYGDARLHFVLVCAAVSCPKIKSGAYFGASMEADLEAQTKAAMNDPDFLKVDPRSGKVQLSKIFEWYADDFKAEGGVVAFINRYRDEPLPKGAATSYYEYDWKLNAKKK